MHDGAAMLAAIESAGLRRPCVTRGPYLYRYVASGAARAGDESGARRIAEHVLATERAFIAAGAIVPVGLRIIAEKP